MKLPLQTLSTALLLLCCSAMRADTLREIYELALQNDAQLKSLEARYRASLETEKLSRAALLPQVNASYEYSESDTNRESKYVQNYNPLVVFDTTSQDKTDREGYQVSLNQAIFDLPAWFSFRAGKAVSRQAEAIFAADQQDLILRTVTGYLAVLRAQDNLTASRARERAFQRQLEQTRQRFEVGLIAITDVHEAQAAYDLSRVDRITDENSLNVALEKLSVLTGQQHSNLHLLGDGFDIRQPDPPDRSAWVDFAIENNFRLAAARHGEEAARKTATAQRMGHLPKVSGNISWSDYETEGTGKNRVILDPPLEPISNSNPLDGSREEEIYQVRVEMPLFAGGAVSANRRKAAQEYLAARESRINLMRNTVTDTRSLHMTVRSDVARVAARRQSIVSSQSALDATTAGYEVGTRNVVDVLNAQNVLFSAKRDYAQARYDYVGNMLRLKQQAGLLSPEDIHQLDDELVPPSTEPGSPSP